MIWINFGRWSGASGKFLRYDRIYTKSGRWTPFIRMRKRYSSWLGFYQGVAE